MPEQPRLCANKTCERSLAGQRSDAKFCSTRCRIDFHNQKRPFTYHRHPKDEDRFQKVFVGGRFGGYLIEGSDVLDRAFIQTSVPSFEGQLCERVSGTRNWDGELMEDPIDGPPQEGFVSLKRFVDSMLIALWVWEQNALAKAA